MLALLTLTRCDTHEEGDASAVFLEAAKSFFANKENLNGLQGLARSFLQPDGGKEVGGRYAYTFISMCLTLVVDHDRPAVCSRESLIWKASETSCQG